jgi:hypothetical protein
MKTQISGANMMHPNEIDLYREGKEGRKKLGEEARLLGRAYVEAFNEQVARQAQRFVPTTSSEEAA